MKKKIYLLMISFFSVIPGLEQAYCQEGYLMHDNLKRTFIIHAPENDLIKGPFPLVIALHGGGGQGKNMIKLTYGEFNELSDRNGFIVVYPDGYKKRWNDGRIDFKPGEETADDVGFISELIDLMIRNYNADPRKVYVTGISNGAIMSYRLGCELSRKIAAIAPVDGNIAELFLPDCNPVDHVSVLAINSTADPLVPYNGGEISGRLKLMHHGNVAAVGQSVGFWIEKNDCRKDPVVKSLPDKDPNDNSRVTVIRYSNDTDNTEVILYSIDGGGHTWPGGLQYLPAWSIGHTCNDFDACDVIWNFFKNHSKQ